MMLIKPPAVFPGDTVAVCAPAGAVEREAVERGVAELSDLGFRVTVTDGVFDRHLFTAGTPERRLDELHALFADPEVRALVCARGGAGIARLLARLDPDVVVKNPKLVIGYSDITALHLWLAAHGIASVHGPMVAHELARGAYDRERFLASLAGGPWPDLEDGLQVLREGEASGRLRGGCLSLLAAQCGTPWALQPDEEGTILFLEDVDERPYRIDRMLQQLRDSGAIRTVRGIVFGQMRGCHARDADSFTLQDVVGEALADFPGPVAWGLSSGHVDGPFVALPLGVRARLLCEGERAVLIIEEAAVS
jgi:muramoyltetrapeptide carboxypeptidase